MLKNAPTLAIVAVDTAENEPLKISLVHFISSIPSLAPPVRHEPLRRLGTGVLGRHQLDVAALLLLRLWLDDVLVDIV